MFIATPCEEKCANFYICSELKRMACLNVELCGDFILIEKEFEEKYLQ